MLIDRVFAGVRARFPGYPVNCARCMSVWVGVVCTGVYLAWPWANWPLALSWLYGWMATSRDA